jgi:hypothetical protein
MKIAPIILFVYCRPYHTQKTIEALKANYLASQSDLYIFSDGPKDIKVSESVYRVREYIHEIDGFRSVKIKERTGNLGLANSIIAGVSEVIPLHGRVIVLEDDLVSSPNFLDFANQSLEKYESEKKIFSIASYTYNLQFPPHYDYGNYFSPRCESLGWGTWIDRWQKADWKIADFKNFLSNKDDQKTFSHGGEDLVDMLKKQLEGKIDSWAVRWCYAHFRNEAYCSYPVISKIIHIGTDKYATHVKFRKRFLDTKLDSGEQREFNLSPKILVEDYIQIQYQRIFRPNLLKKIKKQLLALLNLYKI